MLTGLLLLVVSALMKAYVAAWDGSEGAQTGLGRRFRSASRLGQYLALLAAAVVVVSPSDVAGRTFLLLLLLFASYLGLVLLARIGATLAPDALLRLFKPVLSVWTFITLPLVILGEKAIDWAEARREPDELPGLADNLSGWLDRSGIEGDEAALLVEAARFHELNVNDLMVPRPDVIWLSIGDDPVRIAEQIRSSGHSRFPLCDGSPDQVIGYLHVRDLSFRQGVPASAAELRALARPVGFVPETAEALSLLKRFQRDRSHMAVVVDEFGGTAGIVTLEDLLEALVGDIRDEFDTEEETEEVVRLQSGEVIADGAVRLEELQRECGIEFGDVEEETVGGYIFGRLAREVSNGDEVSIDGATLRVEGVEGLRVTRVRLIPEAPSPQLGDAPLTELAGGSRA